MKTKHSKDCNDLFAMLMKGEKRSCVCQEETKSEHTPGPWRGPLTALDAKGFYVRGIDIDGADRMLALVQTEANARLIAAAPTLKADNEKLKAENRELLKAAKYTLNNLQAAVDQGLITAPRGFQVQLTECRMMLKAAIAKAEGGK